MAGVKGKIKSGGRVAGTPNKRTMEWDEFGKELLSSGVARAQEIMDKSNDDKYMFYFTGLLNYFKPKQSSADVKVDATVTGILNVEALPEDKNAIDKL